MSFLNGEPSTVILERVRSLESGQVFESRDDVELDTMKAKTRYRILSVSEEDNPKDVDVKFQQENGGHTWDTRAWSFLQRVHLD